jgi:hypothetical protein
LHLGDHDPSGVHCFSALDEDVVALVQHWGGDIEFSPLAVTGPSEAVSIALGTVKRGQSAPLRRQ